MNYEAINLPARKDAEKAILGAIILDNRKIEEIADLVELVDFTTSSYRHIFRVMQTIYARGQIIDAITVSDELAKEGRLDDCGGMAFVAELSSDVPSALHITNYAQIVGRKGQLRDIHNVCFGIAHRAAREEFEDFEDFVAEVQQEVTEACRIKGDAGSITSKEAVREMFRDIEFAYQNPELALGLSTGLPDLDGVIQGLHGDMLVVVAARPGMGKSALAANMAASLALDKKKAVHITTLEMKGKLYSRRILAARSRVELNKIKSGRLSEKEWSRIIKHAGLIGDAPFFYDETSHTIGSFERAVRRNNYNHDLAAVFVDYLQLMGSPGQSSREQEVADISRRLKKLSKEIDAPVFALSQLNRKCEERANKRPLPSDLRESGSLEQDADVILFPYRDEVYDPDTDAVGIMEINVAKNRDGGTGMVRVKWNGEQQRVDSLDWRDMAESEKSAIDTAYDDEMGF